MKTTKRFFLALLSFCLLGNMLAKAETTDDGFEYVVEDDEIWIIGYNGASVDSLCFPLIDEKKVSVDFSDANLSVFSEVKTLDLRNVETVWESTFKVVTKRAGVVGFTSLKKVVIGDNTTFMENSFSGVSVTELVFLGNLASGLSDLASTVTTIDLSSVTTIADNAFNGFSQLQTIKNFENVTSIGAFAFKGCAGLTRIDLSNVTSVGVSAFENCGDLQNEKGLAEVVWSESLTEFPASVFSGCAMLQSVTNLEEATKIGDFAFYNCSSLNGEHEFPATLQSVGKDAFWGTRFASVTLNSNPKLGDNAFPAYMPLNLIITDKVDFSVENKNTFSNITYEREFSFEKFATLILPFVPDQFETGELEVFVLDEATEGALAFVPVEEFIPGTPYMVRAAEGVELTSLTGTKQAIDAGPQSVTTGEWSMNGTYSPSKLYADKAESRRGYYYYTSASGGFLYATGTLSVNPFRTYIEGPEYVEGSNVRMLIRSNDGVETEIDAAELEDVFAPADDIYYDMNGCRVVAPVKGRMYIVNGKKVIF